MSHYVIAKFHTKYEAESFARTHKDMQLEVVPEEMYNHKQLYDDVQAIIDNTKSLTKKQKEQIDVAQIVQKLFDYDDSDYNEYIESLIDEQLTAKQTHA